MCNNSHADLFADAAMYESDDIIKYLFEKYGGGEPVPQLLTMGTFTTLTAGVGLAARMGKGNTALPSTQPEKPLIFWGYEASPFVKVGLPAYTTPAKPVGVESSLQN